MNNGLTGQKNEMLTREERDTRYPTFFPNPNPTPKKLGGIDSSEQRMPTICLPSAVLVRSQCQQNAERVKVLLLEEDSSVTRHFLTAATGYGISTSFELTIQSVKKEFNGVDVGFQIYPENIDRFTSTGLNDARFLCSLRVGYIPDVEIIIFIGDTETVRKQYNKIKPFIGEAHNLFKVRTGIEKVELIRVNDENEVNFMSPTTKSRAVGGEKITMLLNELWVKLNPVIDASHTETPLPRVSRCIIS